MKRAIKTFFKCCKTDLNKLFACNRISAIIWNKILEIARGYSNAHSGKWISKGKLQKTLKGIYPLHSQSVQAITDKYCDARLATKLARDSGLETKYPYRHKNNYPTTWKEDGFKIDLKSGKVLLSLGTFNHKQQQQIQVNLPKSALAAIGESKVQQISLIWDGWLKLAIVIEDNRKTADIIKSDKLCGVDLGEIHSVTAFETGGKAVIITGRYLRSIKQYQLKKLAELSSKLSKCKVDSKRNKKLRRAKRRMLQKTNAQIQDLNHKITRVFLNWVVENKISKVYVGNPEGVQSQNKGSLVNQKISRWNFGVHLKYLQYKLEEMGILFEKIEEAYTTQTCPYCGSRHKCSNRNYKCSCGYSAHRDIHGARNILSLGMQGKICLTTAIKETKYLRTA